MRNQRNVQQVERQLEEKVILPLCIAELLARRCERLVSETHDMRDEATDDAELEYDVVG